MSDNEQTNYEVPKTSPLWTIIGVIWYIGYFIYCFTDENPLTPKEYIWGKADWQDYYYPIVIIEYLIFFPIWMWVWKGFVGIFFEMLFNTLFSKK